MNKKVVLSFLASFSFINLFFLAEWANLFGDHSVEQFFLTPSPFKNAYFALGVTVLGGALILSILLWVLSYFRWKKCEAILSIGLLLCLCFPLNFLREYTALFNYYPQLSYNAHQVRDFLSFPILATLMVLIIYASFQIIRKYPERVSQFAMGVGLVFSPVILVTYLNLFTIYNENLRFINFKPHSRKISKSDSEKPKVVWIIFDELDYRLVFEERPRDILLPEMDRFRKNSIFVEKAFPPSDYTIHSIPSLLSGDRVDVAAVQPTDLVLWEPNKNKQENWTQVTSVFKEVKELGYSTALVGWYHSYCKVLQQDLDYCRRFPAGRFGYAQDFWGSIKSILARSLVVDRRTERAFIYNLLKTHKAALEKVGSGQHDFTFLHYSIPHKPYLFDRKTEKLSPYVLRTPESYFGNLILVDQMLGEIRKVMESSGEWNKSVVIVTSDHSWRKSEEYDGKRDFRVPFMIKMADSKGFHFTQPIGNVVTEDFIVDVMRKKITSSENAVAWLKVHHQDFPKKTVLTPIEQEIIDKKSGQQPKSGDSKG
ncbi:MAG: sulfatase-like hydrolase/transferase [Deltaproteobacteria bacterium]